MDSNANQVAVNGIPKRNTRYAQVAMRRKLQIKGGKAKKQERNWLDLPRDVMANILSRVGVIDILMKTRNVCTTWRDIYNDPSMWRVLYMKSTYRRKDRDWLQVMCKRAMARSQGQLIDLTIWEICDEALLMYVAERYSQLRRLVIISSYNMLWNSLPKALEKFPQLEELTLHGTMIPKEAIEVVGRCCPLLKTLNLNFAGRYLADDTDDLALAIGKNLPELRNLGLINDVISNIGLLTILDGCHHLETLDLRASVNIDLNGDLGKRCSKQIKHLKLPFDNLSNNMPSYIRLRQVGRGL